VRRYVIIGSGAAGFAAAEAIRRLHPCAPIQMICDEPAGYYSRPGLAYYLTGEIGEAQLFPFSAQDFQRRYLNLTCGRVERLEPADHRVQLQDGRIFSYDRLLIATGATAVRTKVPGQDLEGVVKLDNLADARLIAKLSRRSRTAVVVGGGITALELVEGLRARGVKTHFFLRKDRYWGNVLDEAESRLVEGRLKEEKVQIHYFTDLAEIHGRRGRVAGVGTQDRRLIACDMVAIAIGIRPRKELAEAAGLKVDRGIIVNEYMQTSDPAIYAAGDVAQVFDPVSQEYVLDSLWGPARQQGDTAGANMTGGPGGKPVAYLKPVAFNVTRLAGLTTTIIGAIGQGGIDEDTVGIVRGDSETWRQMPDAIAAQKDFEINRLRVLVGERHLLGAILLGDQTLSRALQQLVVHRADITPIRAKLLQPDPPLGDLLVDFWESWRNAHAIQQP
jgi:NAD(P)H-nitrite reductase large subunit